MSQSILSILPNDGQRNLLRFRRRQGYTGSACTKNDTPRNGNGSFKLIWRPRSVIAQSVWLEVVGTLTSGTPCGAGIDEHTVMGVLFSLHGTLVITSLSSLPVFLLAHYVSHVPLDAWLGVYAGFAVCAHFFWHWVCTLICVILLVNLNCSRRPDEFERESGHGSVRCALWMTTDLVHRLRSDTVGTDFP